MNYSVYSCSKCGGTISKETRVCPHCHAYLSGIQCNKCHFTGSEKDFIGDICPKCGMRISIEYNKRNNTAGYSKNTHTNRTPLFKNAWKVLKKISIPVLCFLGKHSWDGCECKHCKKSRHISKSDDCEKCSKCGAAILEPVHSWHGCKCTICNSTRDQDHDWSKNCLKCSACGIVRKDGHHWDGCLCIKCGSLNITGHDWDIDTLKCKRCNRSVFEATISIIVNQMNESKYTLSLNTLKWAENTFGKCYDLTLIHVLLLIENFNLSENKPNLAFAIPDSFKNHKELKEAASLVTESHYPETKDWAMIKARLVTILANTAIKHLKNNKSVVPYGACGDLVYEARAKYKRAAHEGIELINFALKIDPQNKEIINVQEQLVKIIT